MVAAYLNSWWGHLNWELGDRPATRIISSPYWRDPTVKTSLLQNTVGTVINSGQSYLELKSTDVRGKNVPKAIYHVKRRLTWSLESATFMNEVIVTRRELFDCQAIKTEDWLQQILQFMEGSGPLFQDDTSKISKPSQWIQVTCFRCGKNGYRAANCRWLVPTSSDCLFSSEKLPSSEEFAFKCFSCG